MRSTIPPTSYAIQLGELAIRIWKLAFSSYCSLVRRSIWTVTAEKACFYSKCIRVLWKQSKEHKEHSLALYSRGSHGGSNS
jgi:hypothetical protein